MTPPFPLNKADVTHCARCDEPFDGDTMSKQCWADLERVICPDCEDEELDDNDWFGLGA